MKDESHRAWPKDEGTALEQIARLGYASAIETAISGALTPAVEERLGEKQ